MMTVEYRAIVALTTGSSRLLIWEEQTGRMVEEHQVVFPDALTPLWRRADVACQDVFSAHGWVQVSRDVRGEPATSVWYRLVRAMTGVEVAEYWRQHGLSVAVVADMVGVDPAVWEAMEVSPARLPAEVQRHVLFPF